ncbi:hypothetical protein M3906_000253 [Vibrio metschnikovii]|uniref:hypothetical protein n=1 Tax=Vibrio metschnikovii TaxID=28172 RepID=UPI001302744E|nr:hypothetical protein [Vibrio metschnikovii]EKO3656442.1 hypothetical protein [Vibrio metschnikovii]EKO3657441.1 hypothetical protein [Vibrio metschnikovii]EKO3894353.1 hypothetical protein [Vibrio metschnikovii]
MEDTKKLKLALQKRFEQVSPQMLSKYFDSKNIGLIICPICSSNDIGVPNANNSGTEKPTPYVIPVKIDTEGPPFSFSNYEYRLICKNCSHTIHFAVWPIMKWIESESGLEEGYWND